MDATQPTETEPTGRPFAVLMEKYLEGALSDEERADLRERLTTETALRREFVWQVAQAGGLRALLAGGEAVAEEQSSIAIALEPAHAAQPPREAVAHRYEPPVSRRAAPRHAQWPTQRRRSWWARWRITAIAAALLVALGLFANRQWTQARFLVPIPTVATVDPARGAVFAGTEERKARVQAPSGLLAGQAVETVGLESLAVIAWPDQTRLDLAGNSLLRVGDRVGAPSGGLRRAARTDVVTDKHVYLARGGLTAQIRPQRPGHPMRAETPHAELRVLGTAFDLRVAADATHIRMKDGSIEVLAKQTGQCVTLAGSDSAVIGAAIAVAGKPVFERSGGGAAAGRVSTGLIALYTFQEGRGRVVRDMSGVAEPVDLRLYGSEYQWLPEGGLRFLIEDHKSIATSDRPGGKLHARCVASGELTVEVWIRTRNLAQVGPGRIIAFDDPLGAEANTQNWMLGQANAESFGPGNVSFRLRSLPGSLDPNQLTTNTKPLDQVGALYHIACTRSPRSGRRLYVNGVLHAATDADTPGAQGMERWDPNGILSVGNRTTSLDRGWRGDILLAAVYDRALSEADAKKNFAVGVPWQKTGRRYIEDAGR